MVDVCHTKPVFGLYNGTSFGLEGRISYRERVKLTEVNSNDGIICICDYCVLDW